MKLAVILPRAAEDLVFAAAFYQEEQPGLGVRFLDEVKQVTRFIAATPGVGSLRYAHVVPGLRMRQVPGFPYLVFYLDRVDHVDVLRVLHGRRDLPAALDDRRDP